MTGKDATSVIENLDLEHLWICLSYSVGNEEKSLGINPHQLRQNLKKVLTLQLFFLTESCVLIFN